MAVVQVRTRYCHNQRQAKRFPSWGIAPGYRAGTRAHTGLDAPDIPVNAQRLPGAHVLTAQERQALHSALGKPEGHDQSGPRTGTSSRWRQCHNPTSACLQLLPKSAVILLQLSFRQCQDLNLICVDRHRVP